MALGQNLGTMHIPKAKKDSSAGWPCKGASPQKGTERSRCLVAEETQTQAISDVFGLAGAFRLRSQAAWRSSEKHVFFGGRELERKGCVLVPLGCLQCFSMGASFVVRLQCFSFIE